MTKSAGLIFLVCAAGLMGQESPAPPQVGRTVSAVATGLVTKVITLKYPVRIGTSDLALLDGLNLTVKRSGSIVVVTGTGERVDTAEAILKQLDVPPAPAPAAIPRKNIELTAYLIIASTAATQGAPLPKDLESPVAQVASMFPYKGFHLFDAIVMRMRSGDGSSLAGVLPQGQQTFPGGGNYSLNLGQLYLNDNAPDHSMGIFGFKLNVSIANGVDKEGKDKFQAVTMQTNIDLKEGQKVVVGKANIDGSANAIIVILTAKVVD